MPVVAACALFPTWWTKEYFGHGPVPLGWYVALVVLVDVAHVWATLFRTYLDSEARSKRWRLFYFSPPLLFLWSFLLHSIGPTFFWTWVAYFAIYHFVSQNYGLLALYKARCGERNKLDYKLDYYTLFAGALGPILIWHASPARRFNWFNNGEAFLLTLPPETRWPIQIVYMSVGFAWVVRQLYKLWTGSESLNHGKLFIMAMSWFTWAVGALLDHQVLSLAFLNLFHGVPFMFLVWIVCQRRYEPKAMDELPLTDRIIKHFTSSRWSWLAFYAVLCAHAVVEESMWELFVYRVYHDPEEIAWAMPTLTPLNEAWITSLLALPQVTHYWLDAFIWKMDGSNVGLREALMKPKAGADASKTAS
eukprot:TRINITY_DN75040_c0_g1_i1.p1 TRINITY_DN75040_c0_g1~~TRINITY_DN75040_c0_g1_i1.p1  ORF type:complete len:406 (+),score=44.53 TRINITY_DN75040_c0_g1_i1:135-1220(+)